MNIRKVAWFDTGDSKEADVDVLALHGELGGAGFGELKPLMDEYIKSYEFHVLAFDLEGLNFVNSETVAYFAQISEELSDRGVEFYLFGAKDQVKDVISAVGLMDAVDYSDSWEDLVKKLK